MRIFNSDAKAALQNISKIPQRKITSIVYITNDMDRLTS